jgi:hypothetical protein
LILILFLIQRALVLSFPSSRYVELVVRGVIWSHGTVSLALIAKIICEQQETTKGFSIDQETGRNGYSIIALLKERF